MLSRLLSVLISNEHRDLITPQVLTTKCNGVEPCFVPFFNHTLLDVKVHTSVNPSNSNGHFTYRQVITVNNSTFCPHSVFMCFVWISEQTAIISLYSINWLVCITETVCVYCAVRTESLNVFEVSLSVESLR
jgi:hypothetical protein